MLSCSREITSSLLHVNNANMSVVEKLEWASLHSVFRQQLGSRLSCSLRLSQSHNQRLQRKRSSTIKATLRFRTQHIRVIRNP